MKVRTYILIPKKGLTSEELLERFIQILYLTIIPVIATYGFLTTQNWLFLITIIAPVFLKFSIEPKRAKIYKEDFKERR